MLDQRAQMLSDHGFSTGDFWFDCYQAPGESPSWVKKEGTGEKTRSERPSVGRFSARPALRGTPRSGPRTAWGAGPRGRQGGSASVRAPPGPFKANKPLRPGPADRAGYTPRLRTQLASSRLGPPQRVRTASLPPLPPASRLPDPRPPRPRPGPREVALPVNSPPRAAPSRPRPRPRGSLSGA